MSCVLLRFKDIAEWIPINQFLETEGVSETSDRVKERAKSTDKSNDETVNSKSGHWGRQKDKATNTRGIYTLYIYI